MSGLHCHVCSTPIMEDDFGRGMAVTVLRRHYCLRCSNRASGIPSETLPPAPDAVPRAWVWGVFIVAMLAVLGTAAVAYWFSRR